MNAAFAHACNRQTSAWAISIARTALTTPNFLLFWMSYQRYRSQTGLKSLSASLSGGTNCGGEGQDQSPWMTVDHKKQQMTGEHTREQSAEKGVGVEIEMTDEP